QAWLAPQVQAIRRADPTRPITVDHVDAVMARLPANDDLDFESFHRYPTPSGASIRANLSVLTAIERAHAGKPFVLSEFGYATDSVDPDRAGLDEAAIVLGLLANHAAGGSKWMLNDMPQGFNMRERTLSAFRLDRRPKPVVAALAALRAYLDVTGSPPGDLRLDDARDTGVRYVYRASDAVFLGGKKVDGGAASIDAGGPAQLFVSWTEPNLVRLWSSACMKATLDLAQSVGTTAGAALSRVDQGSERPVAADVHGSSLTVSLEAGSYILRAGSPPAKAAE